LEAELTQDPAAELPQSENLSDEEYREWLAALAQRHLQFPKLDQVSSTACCGYLENLVELLSSTARFANVVRDRIDNTDLVKELARELRSEDIDKAVNVMNDTGVLGALDELPELTFGQLRRSAIPEDDTRLLARAGARDAETEITITIRYARQRVWRGDFLPSVVASKAVSELKRAADRLDDPNKTKPKKIFNGIGKLVSGAATGAGNVLLVTGSIVAPNPGTAYAAIGSSALAIGLMSQGIGDLRGE
jgi:hypothetical protein